MEKYPLLKYSTVMWILYEKAMKIVHQDFGGVVNNWVEVSIELLWVTSWTMYFPMDDTTNC